VAITADGQAIMASGMCEASHTCATWSDPARRSDDQASWPTRWGGLVERRPRVRSGASARLRARVISLEGFSAHADTDDLEAHAAACGAGLTVLVHGEPDRQDALAERLRARGLAVAVPERGAQIIR
jgi:Cft2 family RNA processing exonuclease